MQDRYFVNLDAQSIELLLETLRVELEEDWSDTQLQHFRVTHHYLEHARKQLELMKRATKILNHSRFEAYEHPDHGDEAPLMIYDKKRGQLIFTSPFWDADDPEEIVDWLTNGSAALG